MMRILLAVNDSPAGLAAARTAIRLAVQSAGTVRAVHVLADAAARPTAGRGTGRVPPEDARPESPAPLLTYVAGLAERAGVRLETVVVSGPPAPSILAQASSWEADVIVLGRSGIRHVGQPFVGSQVLHVLEFADVPVLVVPA